MIPETEWVGDMTRLGRRAHSDGFPGVPQKGEQGLLFGQGKIIQGTRILMGHAAGMVKAPQCECSRP